MRNINRNTKNCFSTKEKSSKGTEFTQVTVLVKGYLRMEERVLAEVFHFTPTQYLRHLSTGKGK